MFQHQDLSIAVREHRDVPGFGPQRRRVVHVEFAAEVLPGGLHWHTE